MLTRGLLIGEILDELSSLSERIKLRTSLNLNDLPLFAEDFCKELLSTLLQGKFINLNAERSNSPGLDLGCIKNKIGIQVSATCTTEKINNTLDKITDDHRKLYERFIILTLGKKQTSYTINKKLAKKNNFNEKGDIWDLKDIAKMAVDLELNELKELHSQVRNQTTRLLIDLEIRPEDEEFPTNNYKNWESMPEPKHGTGEQFIAYTELNGPLDDKEKDSICAELNDAANRLARLPRVTREFFAMLFERREPDGTKRIKQYRGYESILFDSLQRQYSGDFKGELDLLSEAGFVSVEHQTREDYEDGPSAVGFILGKKDSPFSLGFVDYIEKNSLSFRKVLGEVNFSDF
ncbi:SMEK domain-containing protein [Pseudomonas sp. PDM19]|uniref:SMEK domain-containing protein n=1 Tax=Pseudomonas sp. PDM19 TaxID=2769272 RepID=UPI001786FF77|nr:SMEK domain-containing protein [Pseudomonas sp. PDM19]MBD9634567.1 SMEK domain-containing protein [Pseudomonas sp. PDM19]